MENLELSHQEIVTELNARVAGMTYECAVAQATIKKLTAHIEQIESSTGNGQDERPTIAAVKPIKPEAN
jgi:uncharacterized coiled-coil protein SlyX